MCVWVCVMLSLQCVVGRHHFLPLSLSLPLVRLILSQSFSRRRLKMESWTFALLLVASSLPSTEALTFYDPELCYILDGFLGLYGLIITGMFIKEKFFGSKVKEENIYSDLGGPGSGARDPERGRNRRPEDDTYTGLTRRTDGEYKELPVRRERQKKNEQLYQGLSSATRDTYDSLQMQPLR